MLETLQDKLIINMGGLVWRFSELDDLYEKRIDRGPGKDSWLHGYDSRRFQGTLKQVMKKGYVIKPKRGLYKLSEKGIDRWKELIKEDD